MEHFDLGVSLAFWLTILTGLVCIYYGVVNWNKDSVENENKASQWAEEEKHIDEEL